MARWDGLAGELVTASATSARKERERVTLAVLRASGAVADCGRRGAIKAATKTGRDAFWLGVFLEVLGIPGPCDVTL